MSHSSSIHGKKAKCGIPITPPCLQQLGKLECLGAWHAHRPPASATKAGEHASLRLRFDYRPQASALTRKYSETKSSMCSVISCSAVAASPTGGNGACPRSHVTTVSLCPYPSVTRFRNMTPTRIIGTDTGRRARTTRDGAPEPSEYIPASRNRLSTACSANSPDRFQSSSIQRTSDGYTGAQPVKRANRSASVTCPTNGAASVRSSASEHPRTVLEPLRCSGLRFICLDRRINLALEIGNDLFLHLDRFVQLVLLKPMAEFLHTG